MPISSMMDRTKPNIARSQLGFIDFIVRPTFEQYARICPELHDRTLSSLGANRQYFQDALNYRAALPALHRPSTTCNILPSSLVRVRSASASSVAPLSVSPSPSSLSSSLSSSSSSA